MKTKDTFSVDVPLDRVVQTMCSAAYNVEAEKMRDSVVSTEFKEVEQTDARTKFEMHTTEYKRSKTGALNRDDTTHTILSFCWEASRRTMTWRYGNASGASRLQLGGVYRLTPNGDQTQVEHEVEVEVKIPLIGGQISKFIAREFEKTFPAHRALLRRHVQS